MLTLHLQARNSLRMAMEERERINTQLQGAMSLRDAELAEDEEYDGERPRTPPTAGPSRRQTTPKGRKELERGNMELRRRITREQLSLDEVKSKLTQIEKSAAMGSRLREVIMENEEFENQVEVWKSKRITAAAHTVWEVRRRRC